MILRHSYKNLFSVFLGYSVRDCLQCLQKVLEDLYCTFTLMPKPFNKLDKAPSKHLSEKSLGIMLAFQLTLHTFSLRLFIQHHRWFR